MVLTTWVLSLILAIAQPPTDEALSLYVEAASAIADASSTERPLFRGRFGIERTAALMVGVGWKESNFDVAVMTGKRRGPNGACGTWQAERTPQPCRIFVADRFAEAHYALGLMRQSFGACRHRPMAEWLNAFTSGDPSRGATESRARMGFAERLFMRTPPYWSGS